MKIIAAILAALLSFALLFAVAAIPALLLTLVWNNFAALIWPTIPYLSFWMAWAVLVVLRCLLGAASGSAAK